MFDRDVQMSDDKMMELLQEADLESHGYEKEIISQLVSDSGNGKPIFEKRYQFFKTIECSRLREIDQELNRLIPGRKFRSKKSDFKNDGPFYFFSGWLAGGTYLAFFFLI